jgi:F0F1-type ATP synthase alpha subunit
MLFEKGYRVHTLELAQIYVKLHRFLKEEDFSKFSEDEQKFYESFQKIYEKIKEDLPENMFLEDNFNKHLESTLENFSEEIEKRRQN